MATLEIVLAEKNCLGEEVYLALKNVFKNLARLSNHCFTKLSKIPIAKKVKLLRCQPYLCTNLTNFIRFELNVNCTKNGINHEAFKST